MWQIDNRTPFAAERCWARDSAGAEVWLVGVKATFNLADDGTLAVADEQVPVRLFPAVRGDPLRTSLLHDDDLVWGKRATDVLVTGSVYVPEGRPAARLDFGFQVGPVRRLARATGDRVWLKGARGLVASEPELFVTMPLLWERAYGGADWAADPPVMERRNPAGTGFRASPDGAFGVRLPNIEDPSDLVRIPGDRPTPMGFGPVGRHWWSRGQHAGTYDQVWEEERKPILPHDFDHRYQQSAPPAQQVADVLRGGERAALLHLHPRVPRLAFVLPKLAFRFVTRFRDGSREEHRPRLATAHVDTDACRLSLLWVSELACHSKVQKLLGTTVTLLERLHVRVPEAEYPRELGA